MNLMLNMFSKKLLAITGSTVYVLSNYIATNWFSFSDVVQFQATWTWWFLCLLFRGVKACCRSDPREDPIVEVRRRLEENLDVGTRGDTFIADLMSGLGVYDFGYWFGRTLVERAITSGLLLFVVIIFYFVFGSILNFIFGRIFDRFKRVIMKSRGVIIMESAVAGSAYTPTAKMPSSQVAFMVPGALFDRHIGYGVRVGSVIVTSVHVLSNYVGMPLIVSSSSGKFLWKVEYKESNVLNDICYAMVSEDTLGLIQVKKAKLTDLKTPILGEAFYQGSKTTGLVARNPSKICLLTYEGSTKGGMSGGGIWIGGSLVGIHHGNMDGKNTSTYIYPVIKELNTIIGGFIKESSEEVVEKKITQRRVAARVWSDADIDAMFNKKGSDFAMGFSWAEDVNANNVDFEAPDGGVGSVGVTPVLEGVVEKAPVPLPRNVSCSGFACGGKKKTCRIFATAASLGHHMAHVHGVGLESVDYVDDPQPGPSSSFLEPRKLLQMHS